ncbi:PEP-CTERM sorting domain-containing protein [Gimibacter soli]|uniref:PEP-CTERM sorting domain-containing protein n=1 Tax=Gimibacter soli TaxID=3024400 RepID=A0AAE9XRN6_9PROT|nr:PEP-CTERM sorting domain-containing protein [Gimibacter soli]WCL54799.1 PEP-CTERM sorting domain-containing protein [Gimibacter soli]
MSGRFGRLVMATALCLGLAGATEAYTYQITGDLSFTSAEQAGLFGLSSPEGGAFKARFEADGTATTDDAIYTALDPITGDFIYEAVYALPLTQLVLGNVSLLYPDTGGAGSWMQLTFFYEYSYIRLGFETDMPVPGSANGLTVTDVDLLALDYSVLFYDANFDSIETFNSFYDRSGDISFAYGDGHTGTANISNLTLTVLPGGIPEPSTWMLLMMGFGFSAMAARRRRRAVVSGA